MSEKVRVTDSKITDIADVVRQKKNAAGKTYTLDELETEINSLSGPEGKTVTFKNLDSSGGQHIEVVQPSLSWSQDSGHDLSITAKFPTINFWVSSIEGYYPGECDHESPLDLSTLSDDVTITASNGYLIPQENRQLVDMSGYTKKNPSSVLDGYFTNDAKSYFKQAKATSLEYAFAGSFEDGADLKSYKDICLIDTSECTNMYNFMSYQHLEDSSINLPFNTSKVTNMSFCFRSTSLTNDQDLMILDISTWDTHLVTDFSYFMGGGNDNLIINGIIDMSSCNTIYGNMIASYKNFLVPVKLKNVPSDFKYTIAGFTSEDQFQILSHR